MTNKEILQKSIDKATKNRFIIDSEWKSIPTTEHYLNKHIELKQYYPIIFSHDFAKAFWGEILIDVTNTNPIGEEDLAYLPRWQYHLQQMVLEENPLQYLRKFL